MSAVNALAKQANIDPAKMDAASRLLSLGLVGAGTGAAARSLIGLRQLLNPPPPVPFISPGPSTLEIPIIRPVSNRERVKRAAGGMEWLASAINKAKAHVAEMLPNNMVANSAPSPAKSYAGIPIGMALAGGGLAAGWGGADYLLNQQRKSQMQDELDTAKKDYQQALLAQRFATPAVKTAEAAGPYDRLDELYDLLEKDGGFLSDMFSGGGMLNMAPGAGLTAAGLVALGTGVGTYDWTKSRSAGTLLRKAQEERARQLWARSPQPVVAVPKNIYVDAPEEDEERAAA